METLKTAVVVVLLLAVLYGVYTALNEPAEPFPEGMAWQQPEMMEPLQVEFDAEVGALSNMSSPEFETNTLPAMPSQADPGVDVPGILSTPPEMSPYAPDMGVSATEAPPAVNGNTGSPAESESGAWPNGIANPPSHSAATDANTPPATSRYGSPNETFTEIEEPNATAVDATPYADAAAVSQQPSPADGPLDVNEIGVAVSPGVSIETFGGNTEYGTEVSPAANFSPFENAMQSALAKIDEEQWYDALWTLSLFFDSPDLTAAQRSQLIAWLDPLAAKVIYSREHLIEPAYLLQRGDTLPAIADRYGVPWQLLANINGIQQPDLLTAGTSLKVVRGPFRATVDLTQGELILFAGKLYAGRFPVAVGDDPTPQPGDYTVRDKQPGRTYYAGDGLTVDVGDPTNPFGEVWLDLGSDLSIHGSPQDASANSQGCISLSPLDANDIYGILSQGSSITIRR